MYIVINWFLFYFSFYIYFNIVINYDGGPVAGHLNLRSYGAILDSCRCRLSIKTRKTATADVSFVACRVNVN